MAEFLIKVGDNTNDDIIKDRRGCYKHGDIIDVYPDGETADKPWLTVLIVADLDYLKVKKLIEQSHWAVPKTVQLTEAQYQAAKDQVETIKYNDKDYTIYMGKYTNVSQVSNVDGVRTFDVLEIATLDRRRFKIPATMMTQLFPDGAGRRTITKAQFLTRMDDIIDKFDGKALQETTWYSAYKAGV